MTGHGDEEAGAAGKPVTTEYRTRKESSDGLRELNEKSGPVFKIADDPRITRVGKVIRKLSLDELPQFFNVLVCSPASRARIAAGPLFARADSRARADSLLARLESAAREMLS